MRRRFRLLVYLGLYLLFTCGCGLSEYEEKFAKQQERVHYMDQEDEYLGKPIELPKKTEGVEPALAVFLRLPKGILSSPDEKTEGVLFHYGKAGSAKPSKLSNAELGANAKLSGIQDVYLAVTINKSWPDFKNEVLAAIKGSEGRTFRNEILSAPGREPIPYETLSFTEAGDPVMKYQCYFFKNEIYRVAIVFRGPEKVMNSEAAKEAMIFSLNSLRVGGPAKESS